MNNIVIIGSSAAGISAAKEILAVDPQISITVITEDSHYPYYRPYLTEYIGNKAVEEKSNFYLNDEDWYLQNNVRLVLDEKIISIDTGNKTVLADSGSTYRYDKLILATGSSPFVPIQGALEKKNVFTVRSLDDARRVNDYASTIARAVVVGGGLLGLEAAHSLNASGIDVTVVELSSRLLAMQLDPEGSEFFLSIVSGSGVHVCLGESVEEIYGDEYATGVRLGSGRVIETGMIIFSIGVRSNLDLAIATGIRVDRAVLVNEKMETSHADIYACGDVSQYNGKCVALWMPAIKKGKVAGSNAAGKEMIYDDEPYPTVTNSFNARLFSFGDVTIDETAPESRVYRIIDHGAAVYKKLFFSNDRLRGFILINDMALAPKLSAAVKAGKSYSEVVGVLV
jgi:NAD(P)H-nitrite reductase large subunit